jgi:gliding motility-associated-like protein
VFQFFTRGIAKITSVKIFDRWGEVIYYSPNGEKGWDGTYKELGLRNGNVCLSDKWNYL